MKKLIILFVLLSKLIFAQEINFSKLENQIDQNNRGGNQQMSQKNLLDKLQKNNISVRDQIKLNILLSTTFRSIGDYGAAINYLKKSKIIASDLAKNDSLSMKINAQLAFIYFDSNKYKEAEIAIEKIRKNNFVTIDENDKAYLFMQQGYLNFLEKKYVLARKEYKNALILLKKVSPCNQPAVLVKQMQLYNALGEISKIDSTFNKAMILANYYNILKYKIYATEEIKNIYESRNNKDKTFLYNTKLDSLNKIYNKDQNLSAMHMGNEKFLLNQSEIQVNEKFKIIIFSILAAILLAGFGIYFYRKSSNYKKQTKAAEKEIDLMKNIIKQFANDLRPNNENKEILNSELLSDRQKSILHLISEGFTNKEIAAKLFISENTVKYHVKNIYVILDLKDRKDLFRKLK